MRRSLLALATASSLISACTPASTGRAIGVRAPGESLAEAQPTPRQLIRKGRMGVEVERFTEACRHFEATAQALGAQIARLEAQAEERADYLLRVPPAQLDALMDSTAALGKVGERVVSAEDVTEQIIDVEGRLAALRASRDRLRYLMEQATSVGDVVTVERELARVQAELESLEGRLNALRGQVTLSELAVRIEQRHVPGPLMVVMLGAGKVLQKLFVWR